jgi:phosphatidylglycerophosphatase A
MTGLGQTLYGETFVQTVKNKGLEALGTVLYLGRVPWASGTAGSVPGVLLFWVCRDRPLLFGGLTAALFVLGVVAAGYLERKTGETDPGCVVVDEMVGMMAALALFKWSWTTAVAAFLAFRFFDIVKPFPARQFEQRSGGLGVMLDDIVAAAYTWAALRLTFALVAH